MLCDNQQLSENDAPPLPPSSRFTGDRMKTFFSIPFLHAQPPSLALPSVLNPSLLYCTALFP